MSALFLERARAALFFSSSPHTFRLRMIFSIVVFAPLGKMAKSLPVVRIATHKVIVSVDAVFGVELLATTLAGKHIATVLQILCWLSICKDLKALSQTLQCEPKSAHSCPITLNNRYNGVPWQKGPRVFFTNMPSSTTRLSSTIPYLLFPSISYSSSSSSFFFSSSSSSSCSFKEVWKASSPSLLSCRDL